LVSKVSERIAVALARGEEGRTSLRRLLLGTLPVAKLSRLEAVGHKICRAEHHMMSTISFIQVNMQLIIAASRILTRIVSSKGTDMTLI
jgi:hypothetical protein